MAMLINDEVLEKEIQEQRKVLGIDRYDEVWDGVYIMAASPNHEHQKLVGWLSHVLYGIVAARELGDVLPGINVSDRVEDWVHNYRIPDVAVLLKDSKAENHGTFWYGGPDFAVEIVSPNDRSREKLDFYAKVGTRELLIIDRDPWQLELYRLRGAKLDSVCTVSLASENKIQSEVVALELGFIREGEDTRIQATDTESDKEWTL